jgi:hypothetical protein
MRIFLIDAKKEILSKPDFDKGEAEGKKGGRKSLTSLQTTKLGFDRAEGENL